MNSQVASLSRKCRPRLSRYLVRQQESLLEQAYELGRQAIARGLGVLDIARIHQDALAGCLRPTVGAGKGRDTLKAAETFFMEMLSPFEAAHRGFRQANLRLQELNNAVERRNVQLRAMNRRLTREISERKRTETALRQSEDHYRQLFQQASLMQENLRRLSNQVLHVQEEERKRISRELHDEVGQALTAINTNLAILQRNGIVDTRLLKQRLVDSQNLVTQTMDTVHRFARELRPAMLDDLGLVPALRCCLKNFAERTGLQVRFAASAEAEALGDDQKIAAFRVLQESLTNVAKHAQASRVSVSLRALRNVVQMRIKDNGKAFEVDRQLSGNQKKRLGLLGMQERVRLVNGRFHIQSNPGRGTAVTVEIPLCKK